jgi:hypothetical protein
MANIAGLVTIVGLLVTAIGALVIWVSPCDAGVAADACDSKKSTARNTFFTTLTALITAIGVYLKLRSKAQVPLTSKASAAAPDSFVEYETPIRVKGRDYGNKTLPR